MLQTYLILVDGRAYSGDSEAIEAATPTAPGWTGRSPATRNGIAFGPAPLRIEGKRNLRSHLDRILTRLADGSLGAVQKIEIRVSQ